MGAEGFFRFLVLLAASPLLILALHAALNRVPPVSRRVQRQLLPLVSCAVGAIPLGLGLWALYLSGLDGKELAMTLAYAVITYLLLSYSYFHLYNMSETARRVRILGEISSGRKTLPELSRIYQAGRMIGNRLERLVNMGQVRVSGERYLIRSRALLHVARLLFLWGRVLGLKGPMS